MNSKTTTVIASGLALALTAVSLAISYEAGQLRGGTETTKAIWTASNIAVTAAVILLPALTAPENRAKTLPIWLTAFAVVVMGHIQFSIRADAQAAQHRLDTLHSTAAFLQDAPTRTTAEIHREITRATSSARYQTGPALEKADAHIAALKSELTTVTATLTARQQQEDRARTDPVSGAIATATKLKPETVTTASAILLSLTLDLLAMTLWATAASSAKAITSDNPAASTQTLGAAPSTPETPPSTQPAETTAQPLLAEVIQLADHINPKDGDPADARYKLALDAVTTGQIRPTVESIRNFLGCRQIHAQQIAKRIKLAQTKTA